MDKKIIIQLIKQEVEELSMLINALEKQDVPHGVLVDLIKSKIHTLSKVVGLFPGNGQSKSEDVIISGDEILQQRILDSIVESNREEDELISDELSKSTFKNKADVKHVDDYESVADDKSEPENNKSDKVNAELTENLEPENETVAQVSDVSPEEEPKPEKPKIDKPEEPIAEESKLPEQAENEKYEVLEEPIQTEPTQVEPKTVESEPEKQVSEEEKPRQMVLGERFTKDKSLNEKFTSLGESKYKVVGKPVASVKRAIGLNDRFMFTRELFDNDSGKYNTTLEAIDNANNFVEAIEYLEENCKWTKSETSLKFMELVKRRFDN